MSALSNVHASTLLNTSLRSGTYYLALFLTDPTASGTGTEVSGGGYARKIINFSAPSLVSGKEQVSNSAPVDFGTLTADLGTVAYWGIYDGGQFALVRLLYPEQERTQRRRYHGIGGGYRLHFGITRRRANV